MNMFNGHYTANGSARATRTASRSVKGHRKATGRLDGEHHPEPGKPGSDQKQTRRIEIAATTEPAEQPVPIAMLPASEDQATDRKDGVGSSLVAFMRDATAVPLLTPEEEVVLAARISRGDDAAREHLIRANLRLVVKIAREYEHLGLPLMDLISEGTIGLMKAVDRFDPAKGGKLSTYGSWWIKQQIRRALANQGRTIRLPVHIEAKIYRMGRAEVRLRETLGREATDEELSEELGMTAKRVTRLRNSAVRPTSLDAPLGDEDSGTVSEVVGDERNFDPSTSYQSKADQGMVMALLARLPEREARILRCRFGLDGREEQTLEELGEEFGLTRERIRQLQNEAFKKLRTMIENPGLYNVAA
jgi:RNA polymerase primary sigma factor